MIYLGENERIIIADENKDHCVCPMIDHTLHNSPLMCHCSEGFAEKMFSKVTGEKANAVVISSILRGDKSCKYKIIFT
jgi:predicted hydrocarbon binding protein